MSVDDRPMESPLPDSSSDLPPDSDTSPADRKRVSGTLPGSSSVFPASITTADVGNSFADRDLPVTDNGLVVARAGIGNDAERGNSNSSGETALTTDDPDIRARISSIAEVINPGAVRSHEPPVERTVPGPGSGSDSETMAVPTPPAVPVSEDALRAGMLPAGTVLGHFVITQYIGGGGMGRVYLATDSALDRKVAIKVLPRQRVNDPGVVARFMNEARSAARLNHEHIAQVYFAGEQNGVPFIAFEYVEGTNIRTLVEEYGLFPLPQAVNFLIQIAHALVHAGSHGVVHRDVKPSNILITNEGRAKLIDMGLARLLNPSETKEDLTASGVTLGTFDYISPEQARDPRNADIRSDIYSLGCTFFFMLTGRPPFPEGTVLQKLLQHQGDIPPDVREFQPEIPIEVAQLIQKMMAKDPRQRFQTPGTLIDALVVIAEMLGLRPTGPGRIIWVPRPPTRSPRLFIHLPWISTAVLLVIAAFLFNLDGYDHGDLAMPDFASFLSEEESNPAATRDGLPGNGSPGASDERKTGTAHYASDDNSMRESPMRDSGAGSPLPSPAVLSGLFGIDGTPNRFPLLQRLLGTDTPPGNTNDRLALRVPDPGTPTRFALCARPVSFELGGIPSKTGRDVSIHRAIVHPISYRRSDKVIDPRSDEMAVVSRKTLVVDPEGASSESYRTLEAAVAAVDTIATKDRRVTIELRTNQTLFTNPFTIAGGSLAITAAPGFSPTLKFGPGESGLAYSDRSMITIGDGELLLRNIAVEFRVPQEIAVSRWTLFEILDAATLTLERCLVTIRNTSGDSSNETATFHQEVAFFRSVVPPLDFEFFHGPNAASGPGVSDPVSTPSFPAALPAPENSVGYSDGNPVDHSVGKSVVSIRLNDTVIRGEASILYTEVERNLDFSINNAFIASTKPLLVVETPKKISETPSKARLTLEHATVFLRAPLICQTRLSAGNSPLPLQVAVVDTILALNRFPLVDFRGIGAMDKDSQTLRWHESGTVFYQDVPFAWNLKPLSSNAIYHEVSMAEWMRDMIVVARFDPVPFERFPLPLDRAVNRLVPSDFIIRQPDYGVDRINAGMIINPLPKVVDDN